MKSKVLYTCLMVFIATSAFAQWNWPEDPEEKKEVQSLYTLYDDSYKQGNYEEAKVPLDKLLSDYPKLNKSIYINGRKIYMELWKGEQDPAAKSAAAEKVMSIWDGRFANYPGDEAKNIDRKAIDAFQLYFKENAKTQFLLDLFEKTYELKGNNAYYPVGRYYMNSAVFGVVRKIGITDDEVLEIYNRSTEHIDFQIANAKKKNQDLKKYEAIKEAIDAKLADLNLIDCDFIVEKLVPKFDENPDDIELANKIFVFAFDGGCTDEAWFVKAAEKKFESDPNFGVAQLLASRAAKDKDLEKAKEYYLKAVELTDDNTDKAKVLKQLASTLRIEGDKKGARQYAFETINADPSLAGDMYTLIGDMYMGSSECDQKKSQIDDRARFIAAFDMYAKANNRAKMAQAKQQFPTISDIFTANREEGESISVGCWIGGSVSLQRRPEGQQ